MQAVQQKINMQALHGKAMDKVEILLQNVPDLMTLI
jgi:hypothetical protein